MGNAEFKPHRKDGTESERARKARMRAHDIRSALGGVIGALAVIDSQKLAPSDQQLFDQAQVAATMLLDLLDDPECVTRPNAIDVKNIPHVDAAKALRQLSARWQGEATVKNIGFELVWDPSTELTPIISTLDFHRIFNNIIGNAIKFTNKGKITAKFGCDSDNRFYGEISDSGAGFSSHAMENLFTFQTNAEPSGFVENQGSGMGLHIAKTLSDKSGGTIDARNKPKGGAVVLVNLPMLNTANVVAPRAVVGNALPDLSHLKILMAEDNLTNQMVATQMLQAMKGDCVVASDGVEALERLEEHDFDIALIDIEMPRMSGLEVMRNIRQRKDAKAAMPLVALTAYVMSEHQDRINAAGANGLIAKPLTNIAEFGRDILSYLQKPSSAQTKSESKSEICSTSENSEDCIDMTIYNSLADMIGPDSMRELLEKVDADIQNVKAGIEAAARDRSGEKIGINTHILISVAGAIGAVSLQNAAQSLNSLSKTTNWPDILAGAELCQKGCNDVLRFVESRYSNG